MLHDFLTSSWCIGIPQLVRAKNVLVKLIWLLAILAGSALCSWFVINIFHDFYEFKFITESKIIYHESLAFPKVAICSDDGSVRYVSSSKSSFLLFFYSFTHFSFPQNARTL